MELCMRGIEGLRAFAIAKLDVLRLFDVMKRSVDRARQSWRPGRNIVPIGFGGEVNRGYYCHGQFQE